MCESDCSELGEHWVSAPMQREEFKEFEVHFTRHKVSYEKVESPEINLCQLYVVDPNKIKIEMNNRGELK